jgi:hypothetical protein
MADAASIQKTVNRLRSALQRRYPGVSVLAHFNDESESGRRSGAYQGWCVVFAAEPAVLAHHKLVPGTARKERDMFHDMEFVGVTYFLRDADKSGRSQVGYHVAEVEGHHLRHNRALTKKMQMQVTRLLRPFVGGTWKPSAPAVRP